MSKQPAVNLKPKKIELTHVTHDGQKLPTVLIILENTPAAEQFWIKASGLNRFIVEDVQPNQNGDTVNVLFRNLTSKETVQLTQQGVISPAAMDEMMGDTIRTLMNLGVEGDPENEEEQGSGLNLTALWDNLEPITNALMENIKIIPEHSDLTVYRITMPLLQAHLAQILYAKSNSPAFVMVPEDVYKEMVEEEEILLEDCYTLDYPYPTSSEFFSATGSLTQKVEGYYPLNIPPQVARIIRGEVLSLVVNISQGSQDALVRSYGHINRIREGLEAYTTRKNTGTSVLTQKNIEAVYFAECIDRLYTYLFPSTIASIIQEKKDTGQYFDTANLIDDLFNDDELAGTIGSILAEAGHDNTGLTETSTVEEMMTYYSAPVTKTEGYPVSMENLAPKMQVGLLTDFNLIGSAESVKETPENVGELAIAKLLVCAIRYARLITLTEITGTTVNPIACLVFGLTYPDELEVWASIESVRRLTRHGGVELFTEVYTAGLTNPKLDDKYVNERQLLETGLTNILHRVGHTITGENGFTPEELDTIIPDNATLISFVSGLFPDKVDDDDDDMCLPMESVIEVYQFMDFKTDGYEFVKALGEFILKMGITKASAMYPDGSLKDPRWEKFIENWLAQIIVPADLDKNH